MVAWALPFLYLGVSAMEWAGSTGNSRRLGSSRQHRYCSSCASPVPEICLSGLSGGASDHRALGGYLSPKSRQQHLFGSKHLISGICPGAAWGSRNLPTLFRNFLRWAAISSTERHLPGSGSGRRRWPDHRMCRTAYYPFLKRRIVG